MPFNKITVKQPIDIDFSSVDDACDKLKPYYSLGARFILSGADVFVEYEREETPEEKTARRSTVEVLPEIDVKKAEKPKKPNRRGASG